MRAERLCVIAMIVSAAAPTRAFDSVVRGVTVDTTVSATAVGDALMFELGGESAGLRTYRRRRWVLQWDALLAGRAGFVGNQQPLLSLLGIHAVSWVELGHRILATSAWSPYIGVRLGGDVLVMPHPGLSLSEMRTTNDVDGVGGVAAQGVARIEAGVSFLTATHSLLLTGFFQEELDAPEVNTPGYAFSEGGVCLRWDVVRRLVVSLEGEIGLAPTRSDPSHALTGQTTHAGITTSARKIFRNGMWVGATAFIQRNSDHVRRSGSCSPMGCRSGRSGDDARVARFALHPRGV